MKLKVLSSFLGLFICLTGCLSSNQNLQETSSTILLTTEKEKFLINISQDEERIKNGQLFNY